MKKIKMILYSFSWIGLVLSLVVHISSYFSFPTLIISDIPMVLHIGMLIVFIPSLLIYLKERRETNFQIENSSSNFKLNPFHSLYEESPKILTGLVSIFYFYGIINFLIFMSTMDGKPSLQNGKYVLYNRTTFIRELTIEEFQEYNRRNMRGFSGHWMLFYAGSLLLSYPFRKKRKSLPEKERKLEKQLELPFYPFGNRLFDKNRILFILSGISIPAFLYLMYYIPNSIFLIWIALFPINLLLNLYYLVTWSKYYIKFYSVEGKILRIEVFRYNTLFKYEFLLNEIQIKLQKKPMRGNHLLSLSFYNSKNEELFSQYESKFWNANLIFDLDRVIASAKQ